jgi:hypothetical protein
MSEETIEVAETTAVAKKAKAKAEPTGNLILDVAAEVEKLTKTKALHLADSLADGIEENYFKLGGVLKMIQDNSWFEGFNDFDQFVFEKYGFQGRKARYLMGIYEQLVTKQIPWEKVKDLGWTKLKDLASILTPENVDEWVAKAANLTYLEMMALLKAGMPEGEISEKTKSDSHTLKFQLKGDQLEVVNAALAKGKGEMGTEYDSVVLENICAGYVAGTVGGATAAPGDIGAMMQSMGWEAVLQEFDKQWPNIDLQVKTPG